MQLMKRVKTFAKSFFSTYYQAKNGFGSSQPTPSESQSLPSATSSATLPFGPQPPPLGITEPGACNHHTSSGGYAVLRHTFTTSGDPIWRCLKCGKTWKDSEDLSHAVEAQSHYDISTVQALKASTAKIYQKTLEELAIENQIKKDLVLSAFKYDEEAPPAPRVQVPDVFVQTVTDRLIKEDA
jgi:hypothetical protein